MSVVIETTLGDITVDLFLNERPRACLNFLKLCKVKYYNYNLFHTISRSFIAQTGDPTGSRSGGESIFGLLDGPLKRYFEGENEPRIKHTKMGLISFVGNEEKMIGSQFFLTLGEDLTYLDEKHCVFGEVVEGFDILEIINEVICDTDDRPYQDVRITHTVILDDPYPDPKRLIVPSRSPSPTAERLQGGRIAPDEEIDELEGKTVEEIMETQAEREAKARATILEMVGDLPDADMAPPENVLFVCKLNPVTNDDDLEIIFSRFGKIKSCEVIRDKKTGDSLQYAFVEFETQKACEDAYFKMDNVLIDDRRIHVDFSQSVSKVKWHGKGRGVTHYDEKGRKSRPNNDISKGNYKNKRSNNYDRSKGSPERSRSPRNSRDNFSKSNSDEDKKDTDYNRKRANKSKRDISPRREETRQNRNRSDTRDTERNSRKKKDVSLSPQRRKTSHSSNRDRAASSRQEFYESRSSQDYKRRSRNYSPQRNNDERDRIQRDSRKYSKTSETKSSMRRKSSYTPERKGDLTTNRDKLKSSKREAQHYNTENGGKKGRADKKRSMYSSEDSDSAKNENVKKGRRNRNDSSEYRTKVRKQKSVKKDYYDSDSDSNSSEESDSDKNENVKKGHRNRNDSRANKTKMRKLKNVKKDQYDSDSDSDHVKKKKSKKKRKDYSDSD